MLQTEEQKNIIENDTAELPAQPRLGNAWQNYFV